MLTMPARSKAQQRLMSAAEHGAEFPMARKIRSSMTHQQMHDFAHTKRTGLPAHVPTKRTHKPHHSQQGQLRALGGRRG